MSSKFNPSNTPRLKPPWCKPGMFPAVPPLIDGKPSYVIAFLAWRDLDAPDQTDISTALRMPLLPDRRTYEAIAARSAQHLGGQAIVDFTRNIARLEVRLFKEGVQTEADEFEQIWLGVLPDWDSNLQIHEPVPGRGWMKIQVWA